MARGPDPERLTHILENYAQVVEFRDERTGRKSRTPLAALPPARRGAPAARRRRRARRRPALLGPALRGQRQEQLHRLAGASVDRAREGRRPGLRFRHRGHRPAPPRPADPRHDQAVRPGRRDRGPRESFRRSPPLHRVRQEDHHLDGAEVPLHPRRDRQRATRPALRHHHRRGPLKPGRAHQRSHGPGALRGRRGGGRRDLRGPDQPAHGVAKAAPQRELLRLHRDAQEQDAGDLRRAGPPRSPTARSSTTPSTATP